MPFGNYSGSNGGTSSSKWGSSPPSSGSSSNKWGAAPAKTADPVASLDKQISNAQLRIKSAGGDVKQDKRNGFEKWANLPEGQNFLFDALDLLGRPQQALYGAVQAGVDGKGIGSGAWQGFSGKQRISGSDFMEELGVENKYAKAGLGFVTDVVADPTNLIPGAVIAKGVGKVGQGAKKAYNAAESAVPALGSAKDGLGNMFVHQYGWENTLDGGKSDFLKKSYDQTENDIRYMGENSLRDITQNAKAAGGIDTGEAVGRIMEAPLRQFEDVKAYEFPDGLTRTEDKSQLFTKVGENRDVIKGLGKEINQTNRVYNKAISTTADELTKMDNMIRRTYYGRENAALRQLNNRKNKPLNIDELAQGKAFEQVSISPKFNLMLQRRNEFKTQLDELRSAATEAKTGGISDIQKLTGENASLREAAKNPVMMQKEIARPQRELSTDPNINQSARELMKSNDMMRQWALDNGVQIGEVEGYMRHILSSEEQALRKSKTGKNVDRAQSGMNNPNKGLLKARKLPGSVEDVNEKLGRKIFEPNAYFSTAVGQKKLVEYGNAVKFRREVLGNNDFARKFNKGDAIPDGAEIINTNNYKFLDDPNGVLPNDIGGEYAVTKGVKQALDRYNKLTTDEGINAFLKTYDKGMSLWKRGTLLSVPYHVRNDLGAKFNSFVAGMGVHHIAKYSTLAERDVRNAMLKGKETPLYNEFRRQGLGSSSQLSVEFARRGDEPGEALKKIVGEQSKTGLRKAGSLVNPLNLFQNSQNLGNYIDQTNRFALYRWARETKKMNPEEATAKVREVQFDYTRTTPTEREVFARLAPFYRWSRNNIPFQLRTFAQNPRRYMAVNKVRLNLQDSMGIEEQDTPDYLKENFFMPVTGDGQGKGQLLGANLPVGDLTKLTKPGKLAVDSLSKAVTLPIELVNNRNLYFNNDIQRFEGQQKKYEIPDNFYGMPVPGAGSSLGGLDVKTAYALEQLGGQPVRGLSKFLSKPTIQEEENRALMPGLGISSFLKPYDTKDSLKKQKQKELRDLQDYIDVLEQEQGKRPKTVNEIKKGR